MGSEPFKCGVCRKTVEPDTPDPCWGELPGVEYACCGHGTERAYISFTNGTAVYFEGSVWAVTPECDVDDGAAIRGYVNRA